MIWVRSEWSNNLLSDLKVIPGRVLGGPDFNILRGKTPFSSPFSGPPPDFVATHLNGHLPHTSPSLGKSVVNGFSSTPKVLSAAKKQGYTITVGPAYVLGAFNVYATI